LLTGTLRRVKVSSSIHLIRVELLIVAQIHSIRAEQDREGEMLTCCFIVSSIVGLTMKQNLQIEKVAVILKANFVK